MLDFKRELHLTPDQLSEGMKRKLCVGIALTGAPEVLIINY